MLFGVATISYIKTILQGIMLGLFFFGFSESLATLNDVPDVQGSDSDKALYAFALYSITPSWHGIPYPDTTDLVFIGLIVLMVLIIIRYSELKNRPFLSSGLVLLSVIIAWVVWKAIMYFLFLSTANSLGINPDIRTEYDGVTNILFPSIVCTLFSGVSSIGVFIAKWNL